MVHSYSQRERMVFWMQSLRTASAKFERNPQFTLKSGDVFRDQALRRFELWQKEAAQDLEQTMYLKILLFVPEV